MVSRSESWPLAGTSAKGKHFPGSLVPDGFTFGSAGCRERRQLSLSTDGWLHVLVDLNVHGYP